MMLRSKISNLAIAFLTLSSGTLIAGETHPQQLTQPHNHQTILGHQSAPGHICGTDKNHQDWSLLQKNNAKELSDQSSTANQILNQLTSSNMKSMMVAGNGEPGRYYIPVVFHVYGSEFNCNNGGVCLTDAKIIDALNKTNEDFRGLNTQDGPIDPEFQAIRENLDIEFVLAKKDPNGNPTNGIVRRGEKKGYGDDEKKNSEIAADSWDNFKYMNIYIMKDLYDDGGTTNSGVAWYPELSMSQAGTARVVYNGSYLGTNTSENFRSVLTHEFGHWLNLPHTFDGNTCSIHSEAFCASTGDRNCDTPQISASFIQENKLNCLGQKTNTENFMHYSDNYAMYTKGQVSRMIAALHGAARKTLWSNNNLIATGLEDLTSNADHPWDGSGVDIEPQGTIIQEVNNISAQKGEVKNYQTNVPAGTEAVAFYLTGYAEDPDMYVSKGQAPTKNGGKWNADFISFMPTGTPELVAVTAPSPSVTYHTAVDAFTSFSNADFKVISAEDPTLCNGCERVFLLEESGISGNKGDAPIRYQFDVPSDATRTVIVIPGGYLGETDADGNETLYGDPDVYGRFGQEPTTEEGQYDCRPWSAPKLSEFCEIGAGGGTLHVMVDPFINYKDATLRVYYERPASSGLPTAEANGPYSVAAGDSLQLSSNGSNDPNGSITAYNWDFGDGNSSTQQNPQHTYNSAGSYTIKLTVTDDSGNQASDNASVTVSESNDKAPVAEANGPYSGSINKAVSFSSTGSNDPDGSIANYAWDFGDGASSTDANPTHAYSKAGKFNVTLTVTDDSGNTNKDTAMVTISNAPAYCEVSGRTQYEWISKVVIGAFENTSAASTNGYEDFSSKTVALKVGDNPASLTSDGGYSEHWTVWIDFNGNGIFDSDEKALTNLSGKGEVNGNISVPSSANGVTTKMRVSMTYRTQTSACGNLGDSEAEDYTVTIGPDNTNKKPTANANGDYTAKVNQSINFSSRGSNDPDGTIDSYAWDFGNGDSSTSQNPTYSYASAGVYTVTLKVTDNKGASHSDTARVTIIKDDVPNTDVPDACATQSPITSGELKDGQAACLGQKSRIGLYIGNVKNHQSIAITTAYGQGDLKLTYRNGGWPTDSNYDAKSDTAGNTECIYLTGNNSDYWSYLYVEGNATGASIIVDFDSPACR
ncbi:PKD domain-containing protein [Aliikangiella sp. IMCC44359]|uniref:PKD domain-containing protein n=1 Tax=Aliikangiella sp. IMCC44359 TaxID=3459125 RepID=UPI00403B1D19